MERAGSPPGQPQVQQKLAVALQTGQPPEKVRALETYAKYARIFHNDQAGDAEKALVERSIDAVRRGDSDPDPTVHAWASYLFTVMTADRAAHDEMLKDPSWLVRTLAVLATDLINAPRATLAGLNEDPDPVVRQLAAATIKLPQRRAATGPATQPGTTLPAVPTSLPAGASPAAAKP
jgi:hypothetical protein